MGEKAAPLSSAWLPEDDFKLTNAIQGGRSFEELAEGAVQFSRKFTLKEIRKRWDAILHDSNVSAGVSGNMVELQQRNKGVCGKRNSESVQEIYYSRCNRICKEQVKESYAYPDDCSTELVSTTPCSILSDSDKDNAGTLERLESFLLDFTPEELFHMDVDGENVRETSCYNDFSTLILYSPDDAYQDPVRDTTKVESSVTYDPCRAEPLGACVERNSKSQILSSVATHDLQYPEFHSGTICCTFNTEDTEIPCNYDTLLSSKSSVLPSKSVIDNRGNPKASDIMLDHWQRELEEMENYLMASTVKVPSDELQVSERGPAQLKKNTERYLESSTVKDHSSMQNGSGRIPDLRTVVKRTLLSSSVKACSVKKVAERGLHKKQGDMKSNLTPSSVKDLSEVWTRSREVKSCRPSSFSTQVISSEPSHSGKHEIIAIGPDQMRNVDESSGPSNVEINDNLPHFSDVEAVILDMDSIPDGQYLSTWEEVVKFQDENDKKDVIRLEQAAYSSVKRDIASHGAFASLKGFHLSYYIKKPEVSLGRSTEHFDVDIDLRREGKTKKISRLQGTIKLNKDGSFYLGNLGKYLIYVNDDKVLPGKSVKLRSGSLIEIQELSLIFDVHPAQVKAYLESTS